MLLEKHDILLLIIEVIKVTKIKRKTPQERKDEIKQSAIKVFIQKGFRNTTMEDIIFSTTLSKGGFYHYYKSTMQIFFEIMEDSVKSRLESAMKRQSYDEISIDVIVDFFVEKIINDLPQASLYVMFLAECLDNEEFKKELIKMEKDFYFLEDPFVKEYAKKIPETKMSSFLAFFNRFISGLMFSYRAFPDDKSFEKHRDDLALSIKVILEKYLIE